MVRCPIHCPKCNRIVLDSMQDGGYKLRARMLLFTDNGEAQALCPSCKHKVNVPVTINKTIAPSPKPYIYVAK